MKYELPKPKPKRIDWGFWIIITVTMSICALFIYSILSTVGILPEQPFWLKVITAIIWFACLPFGWAIWKSLKNF